jgi:hypothetical protein
MSKYLIKTLFTAAILSAIVLLPAGCNKKVKKTKRVQLIINTSPQGATVYTMSGKEQGQTPFKINVRPKSYILKIHKENYLPVWQKFDVEPGKKKVVNIKLESVTGSALVISRPQGAKVYINNHLRGSTPLVLDNLPLGKHSARIEKTGYTTRTAEWDIKNARPQEVIVSLDSSVGRLYLTSSPSHAKIFLNDKEQGFTPYKAELEEGRYRVRLSKSGYNDIKDSFMIIRDRTTNKKINLVRLPGALQIITDPAGAAVYINNRPYGNSPVIAKELATGSYRIKVAKHGFDPSQRNVYVTPGRQTSVTFKLSKNTGGIDLVINPPGTTIYINGKKYGVTEQSDAKFNSKVIHIRNLSSGMYQITAAHKRARPDKKSITVIVQKGQISRPKPLGLWVANAELKLNDGKVMIGLLYAENKDAILFGPEPGVKIQYKRSEIQYLKPLKIDEE